MTGSSGTIGTPGRGGFVLIAAITCLVVVGLMCGSLLKLGLAQRDQVRLEERRVQAEWLAEAGLERAAAKLVGAAAYKGETWTLSAADLGGRDGAVVRIVVEPVAARPDRRLVRIEADYPREPRRRVRQGKQAVVARAGLGTTGR